MNLLMRELSLFSMSLGIPCTFIRYYITPATCIWTISPLPSSECFNTLHLFKRLMQFSTTGAQVVAWSTPFPSQAPSMWTGSPSLVIWMFTGSSVLSLLSLLTLMISSHWVLFPSGMISVFFMLNFTPDTLHHSFRMSWRLLMELFLDSTMVVLSANSLTLRDFLVLGIWIQVICLNCCMLSARGSIVMSNSRQDSVSPCLTPLCTLKGLLSLPFISTVVCMLWYRTCIILMNPSGKSNFLRTS